MLMAVHAGAGAMIGELSGSIWEAFTISFLFHFIMDLIPHGDQGLVENHRNRQKLWRTYAFIFSDLVATLIFLFALSLSQIDFNKPQVMWGGFGGILPDLLVAIYQLTKIKFLKRFNNFHYYIHEFFHEKKNKQISFVSGIAIQTVLIIFLFKAIF